ncbi:MAG TPA: PAS domain S-box protein [Candidatus Dormibacteraeota bacterium]|nr:PAS domain S-box protein [Candidatus Dormibacteraeota bacterium]
MVLSSEPVYSVILSGLACFIPPYALRLTRVFGTKRVGWVIFSAFVLLGALQLVRAWHPMGLALDPSMTLDLLYMLIPVLLLIGMMHIETILKERLRIEEEEKRIRGELEQLVRERTVDLDKVNDELQREINLRKTGEQELRKSKEGYRFLFDENPLPMWILDLESLRFLAFNNAALRYYGFSRAEFKDMSPIDLCVPTEVAAYVEECARNSNAQQRRVWHHRRKDGSVADVELTVHDLVYAERPGRLVLAYDVSGWQTPMSPVGASTASAQAH